MGGCVNCPGSAKFEFDSRKDRAALLSQADNREIRQNLKENVDVESFSMHRKH
jgi:ferredoxin hydrogenase large subunit